MTAPARSVLAQPFAQVRAGVRFQCDPISEAIGEGCGECDGCVAWSAIRLIEQRAAEMERVLAESEVRREAAEARVTALEATRPEARYAAAMRVVALIRLAHDRHLATGDYITLGIAAQDALSEFDRAALSAREEQK